MELKSIFVELLSRYQEETGQNLTGHWDLHTEYLSSDPVGSISYIVFIILSIVVGFIGNILIIGAVCCHKKLRTTGNVFIVNLAIADLGVVCIVQPFNIIGIFAGPEYFIYKEELCHVISTVCVMSCSCSMMNLAAIALNRYIYVCKNVHYDVIYNRKTTPVICVCMWTLAFLIDLPSYLGWGAHTFDLKSMGCSFDRLYSHSYTLFLVITIFILPFFLVFSLYLSIYLYVRKTRQRLENTLKNARGNNQSILESRRQDNIRLIRTFFIVVVVFLICWTPYGTLVAVDVADAEQKLLYVIFLSIGHLNSSINCILYGATNPRLREGYKEFLKTIFCFRKRKRQLYIHTNGVYNISAL